MSAKGPNPPPPEGSRPPPPPAPPGRSPSLADEQVELIRAGVWFVAWLGVSHRQAGAVTPETFTRCADACLADFEARFPMFARPTEK